MNRDVSVSAFNPEFAFENINLRLSTNEGNTMMSWVNERGTKEMTLRIDSAPWSNISGDTGKYQDKLLGTVVGTAVLNHKLVIFTVGESVDYIYSLWESKKESINFEGKILYIGELHLSVEHPLETLVSYESESTQKVYWTDGVNQPRVINIAADNKTLAKWNTNSIVPFDFVQELALKEEVRVSKVFGSGEFPAGVIQYAFTYYNKYGQESNIFYTTPLQYISYVDRGGSAESKIANSFKIQVSNIDSNFNYLRIYSILRTSKDATPFCKRIQDVEITNDVIDNGVTFIDTGLQGDSVDPTELLYLGGEEVVAETIEQKDGTLFLGNVNIARPPLPVKEEFLLENEINREISNFGALANDNIKSYLSYRDFSLVSKKPFRYVNTLSCFETLHGHEYEGATGFKSREYYRLGVQFQYKNGKWSEPCWVGDKREEEIPVIYENAYSVDLMRVAIPGFEYTIQNTGELTEVFKILYEAGYRRVRPVFAVPKMSDRTILLQGVGCPIMSRKVDRYANPTKGDIAENKGRLYAQSSWLFRVPTPMLDSNYPDLPNSDASNGGGKVSYYGKLNSQFEVPMALKGTAADEEDPAKVKSPYLRSTEVMGIYDDTHSFYVDDMMATIHSPELIFDTEFNSIDFQNCKMQKVGYVKLSNTYGDIDIQTSTPAIGSDAAGFVHKSIVTDGAAALIAAPFYNDYLVDDIDEEGSKFGAYNTSSPTIDYPIYMWHKNGSLNNDVARSNRSAELLKKKISNYRWGATTTYYFNPKSYNVEDMQLFNSDELSVVKVAGNIYMGNIETMLTPTTSSPHYIIGDPWRGSNDDSKKTDFLSDSLFRTGLVDPNDSNSKSGVWEWKRYNESLLVGKYWSWWNYGSHKDIGDYVKGLAQWREPISMKYKSTPHLVVKLNKSGASFGSMMSSDGIFFGRATDEDVQDCMPLVEIYKDYDKNVLYGGTSNEALKAATWIPCGPAKTFDAKTESLTLEYKWGDTYFQRFECLKTYPFTQEDKNQVVEIASFMCETRVNMDGRYDRNRAQTSNLNMTPQNFNLINPVYSQMDNFFSYKMLDENDYKNVSYPNNVTWTKTKQNGADIDLWTNITMANVLELDGDKGTINKLLRFNNQLLAFQDSGISQILYNENTQISTTEGVPIEIANSEKVQGKRYLSDTVGCSNKWSMAQTPSGIYFMDSNGKSIYLFNGQLNNISTAGGFNAWAKQYIPSAEVKWKPSDFEVDDEDSFVAFYDKQNQDVLFINNNTALAYSEKFNCFTSFYDYGGTPFFENLDDIGIWVKGNKLWKHQAGEYGKFFGDNKPYSMTLIANQEPQMDKIFTNLEFRACVSGEGIYDESNDKFTPSLPFDNLEAWDEYQHGITTLNNRNRGSRFEHGIIDGILARKFRIWRCDIPRDNAEVDAMTEAPLGIKRFKKRPLDRIRNTWAYLKLGKNAAADDASLSKTEIHDIMATYFA